MEKKDLIEAILDPENWRPNITRIAEQTELSQSTVSEAIKRRMEQKQIMVEIRNLSEAEALAKRKEEESA